MIDPDVAAKSDPRARLESRRSAGRPVPKAPRVHDARGRAEALCDPGSFSSIGAIRRSHSRPGGPQIDGDGVVVGWGKVDGRIIAVVSHEFSSAGGSIGTGFAAKVVRMQDLAIAHRVPIVYLNDSGGARIHEGVESLNGCGEIFRRNVLARDVSPQISVILGPCAGAAAYSPALTDWTIMVRGTSHMFLTGPDVVRAATGEVVTAEEIGGAVLHTRTSGVAHLAVDSDDEAFAAVRRMLGYLPTSRGDVPPICDPEAPQADAEMALPTLVPVISSKPFDMLELLRGVVDGSDVFELMPEYGTSMITALARLDGTPVGVVASQPARRGGILDSASSRKVARFVRFCGRFGLPIITFVDVPGFIPGVREESRGIITHGAEVLAAYVETMTPKLTVIVRKAYGGAYIALGSRALGADFSWAFADSEIAVMGPGGAVNILHRRAIADAPDPIALRNELAADYRERVTRPFTAAEAGVVDDVILPSETRSVLVSALDLCCARSQRPDPDAHRYRPYPDLET